MSYDAEHEEKGLLTLEQQTRADIVNGLGYDVREGLIDKFIDAVESNDYDKREIVGEFVDELFTIVNEASGV